MTIFLEVLTLQIMLTRQQAKVQLKRKGWSYRTVAPKLGVTFEHLCRVLNGQRTSRRLIERIQAVERRAA